MVIHQSLFYWYCWCCCCRTFYIACGRCSQSRWLGALPCDAILVAGCDLPQVAYAFQGMHDCCNTAHNALSLCNGVQQCSLGDTPPNILSIGPPSHQLPLLAVGDWPASNMTVLSKCSDILFCYFVVCNSDPCLASARLTLCFEVLVCLHADAMLYGPYKPGLLDPSIGCTAWWIHSSQIHCKAMVTSVWLLSIMAVCFDAAWSRGPNMRQASGCKKSMRQHCPLACPCAVQCSLLMCKSYAYRFWFAWLPTQHCLHQTGRPPAMLGLCCSTPSEGTCACTPTSHHK